MTSTSTYSRSQSTRRVQFTLMELGIRIPTFEQLRSPCFHIPSFYAYQNLLHRHSLFRVFNFLTEISSCSRYRTSGLHSRFNSAVKRQTAITPPVYNVTAYNMCVHLYRMLDLAFHSLEFIPPSHHRLSLNIPTAEITIRSVERARTLCRLP